MRIGRLSRPVAVTVVGFALLVGALPATGASADPTTPSAGQVAKAKAAVATTAQQVGALQAKLAKAQAQLDALGTAIDTASEAYDGAMYKLQKAQAAAAAANAAAAGADKQAASARTAVGQLAAATYRGGGATLGLTAVLTADSPDAALDAASTLTALAGRQNDVLDQMHASQVVAGVLRHQATNALVAVNQAAQAAKAAKDAVQAKVDAQAAAVSGLNAETAALNKQLTALTAKSAQLTQARKDGLAREAAARAAAARAAAAAAAAARAAAAAAANASSSSSSSSSNNPTSSSGGSSSSGSPTLGHSRSASAAIAFALSQLGKPYEWAATGPNTWDCSGLTQAAWRAGGVNLDHWSVAQWMETTRVSRADLQPGDLIFYANNVNDYTTIHHVAMYLGGGVMIEAPHTGANVRYGTIDEMAGLIGFGRP